MQKIIELQVRTEAPAKPNLGENCNGCGLCCIYTTCSIAKLLLWKFTGTCSALQWNAQNQRYECGLLTNSQDYIFKRFPQIFHEKFLKIFIKNSIKAGSGCDCEIREIQT